MSIDTLEEQYGDFINIALMDRSDRAEYYHLLYQAAGELSFYIPDPYPFQATGNNDPIDFPQDIPGEWHTYNAASHALLTLMDALGALESMTENGDEAQEHTGATQTNERTQA